MSLATSKTAGRVSEKVALITGAGSGIGAATAHRLAQEGASIVATDINGDSAAAVAAAICAVGGKAQGLTHDVTSVEDWDRVVQSSVADFGGIDVLVNNAGIATESQELMSHDLATWRRVLAVNLDGVFLGLRACGRVMQEGGGGSVINLASIMGKVGLAGLGAYCASKGAVTLLTKSAAVEWAPFHIRVNSIHPGFAETPLVANSIALSEAPDETRALITAAHPVGRLGSPSEIADAIVFLASDESSFMTGSELVVDGGYTAQ